MLNQCIFIGKVISIKEKSNDSTSIIIDTSPERIKVKIPIEMASQEHLTENITVAIKSKVCSDDGVNYRFIAERITILGGTHHGT